MQTLLDSKLKKLAEEAGFENGFEVEGIDVSTSIKCLVDAVKIDIVWEVVKHVGISMEHQLLITDGINKLYSGE